MEQKQIKSGLGGWLIVIGVYLIYPLIQFVIGLFNLSYLSNFISKPYSAFLNSPSINFLYNISNFQIIFVLIFLFASIYLIVLFFNKKKTFPKLFIYFLFFNLGSLLILEIYNKLIYIETYQMFDIGFKIKLFKQGIYAFICGAYITRSKRVKATFIN